MIAIIVCGIIILLGIVLLIYCISSGDDYVGLGIVLTLLGLAFIGISHYVGYKGFEPKNENTLAEKHYIEYCLKTDCSEYMIKKAQQYNKGVDFGNNYWCRFKLEDRSYYKIDINECIGDFIDYYEKEYRPRENYE